MAAFLVGLVQLLHHVRGHNRLGPTWPAGKLASGLAWDGMEVRATAVMRAEGATSITVAAA